MRKMLSLLLVLALCVAVALPAFAANGDETAEPQACSHTYRDVSRVLKAGAGEYINANTCHRAYTVTQKCTKCGYTRTVTEVSGEISLHDFNVVDASCNGTMQTWQERCQYCYYRTVTTHYCPGAPHIAGNCNYLPI